MRAVPRKLIALPAAVVLLASLSPRAVEAQPLPPQVQTDIDGDIRECKPQKAMFGDRFITRKDVNGDGIQDYILDYAAFKCGDNAGFYCGSAGCVTTVYASISRGGYVKVLNENVRAVRFKAVGGTPAMILDLHGSSCGLSGAAPCTKTLYWNGAKFVASR
ncbi:hypothetical protein OPKNFCMD_6493 [Methylobacterium crusticola]|uniref:Uncharacterized protein n=1 Tax=Methylobacterium crusticola TaxID=1697972 RepID=A0ABQ4R7M0_9HYPH|nr:hypothetical protein [Methylobacterium crusticola]GJD53715.1 hypothetical protein OPKNFCMD_6493 [Methylobacterium crusticola]